MLQILEINLYRVVKKLEFAFLYVFTLMSLQLCKFQLVITYHTCALLLQYNRCIIQKHLNGLNPPLHVTLTKTHHIC